MHGSLVAVQQHGHAHCSAGSAAAPLAAVQAHAEWGLLAPTLAEGVCSALMLVRNVCPQLVVGWRLWHGLRCMSPPACSFGCLSVLSSCLKSCPVRRTSTEGSADVVHKAHCCDTLACRHSRSGRKRSWTNPQLQKRTRVSMQQTARQIAFEQGPKSTIPRAMHCCYISHPHLDNKAHGGSCFSAHLGASRSDGCCRAANIWGTSCGVRH